jgi:hypothetical protein
VRHEAEVRERYLRDDLPIRLGGLAANLARIGSFSENPENFPAIETMIIESEHFIEWIAPDTPVETLVPLVDLQIELARWAHRLPSVPGDPAERAKLALFARAWSDRVLAMSGLLDEPARLTASG